MDIMKGVWKKKKKTLKTDAESGRKNNYRSDKGYVRSTFEALECGTGTKLKHLSIMYIVCLRKFLKSLKCGITL